MLNVYCWRCGTQVNKDNILGLGHFDQEIGKYQGKAFIAFRCPKCEKVRHQILDTNLLSIQKKSVNKHNNSANNNYHSYNHFNEIDIDQVIDFFEVLNDIDTVDGFLEKCRMSNKDLQVEVNKPIVQPLDVYNLFNELNELKMKRLMILTLNEENCIVNWEFLGEDTGRPVSFEPKVIFHTPFLLKENVSVIIAENLKEDFVKPTQKEILLTKRLIKTGRILGIDFLDHIVIQKDKFQSYDQLDLL